MTGRRLLLLSLLSLAVLVPAWPAWLGWQSERQFAAYEGSRMGDLLLAHRLESFERGWFSSRAESHVRLRSGMDTVEVPVRHQIRHGYGRVVVESEPVYPPEVAERLASLFGARPPLSVSTRLGPRGDMAEIHLYSPAFEGPLPEQPDTYVRSAGLEGVFHLNAGRLQGSVRLPEFSIRDAESRLTASGQVLELDLADPGSRLADGRLEYRVELLDLEAVDQQRMRLERLRMVSAQERDGGQLNMRLDLGFAGLSTAGWEAGGGDLRLRLGPVDAAAFDDLLRRLEWLEAADGGDSERHDRVAAVFREALPQLLADSPELHLETLRLHMPRGHLELALRAAFDGEAFGPESADHLERLRLSGRLEAGQALAEELAGEISLLSMGGGGGADVSPEVRRMLSRPVGRGVIQGLAEQGYVVPHGDGYRADIRLENGRLRINDVDRSEWLYLLLAGLIAPDGFN
jgi:hypothetical protein